MRFRNDVKADFAKEIYVEIRRATKGEHRYADLWLIGKALLLAGGFLAGYAGMLDRTLPGAANIACAIFAGVCALLLAINVGHDAAHDCFVRSRWGNRLLQRITFTLIGVDSHLWRFRHAYSHHPFPNINDCDIDIDQNPFFRLSPNQPARPYFRFQHIYAPFVYGLVVLHTVFVQDFMYLYQRRIANLCDIRHSVSAHAMFYLSKFVFLTIAFAVPVYIGGYGVTQVALTFAVVSAVVSVLFVFLLVGTHFSDVTVFPEIQPDGTIGHSQTVHALESAQDWCTRSRIANFLTGGANCHAAHHLLPRLSHRHYRRLSPLIEATARKYGVRYSCTSFRGLIGSHFRFLKTMSHPATRARRNGGY